VKNLALLVIVAAVACVRSDGGPVDVPPPVEPPPVEPPPDTPPPDPGFVVPSSLHFVQGRPLTIFRAGLTEVRGAAPFVFEFAGQSAEGASFLERVAESVALDGARLAGAGEIRAHPIDDLDVAATQAVTFYSSAATKSGSPKILVIGDSLSFEGTVSALNEELVSAGVTPEFLGTMQDVGGVWCEGRSSWEFSDFTRKNTIVNADGSGATYPIDGVGGDGVVTTAQQYLALDPRPAWMLRWQYNPFIRPARETDEPALVKNGYVFDVRFYLDRFGIADPDIVMIALGTNDTVTNDQATGNANAIEGLALLLAQVRSALPHAAVAVIVNGFPADDSWAKHLPFVKHVLDTYGGREAEGVYVLPAYMVVDPSTVADGIHPDAIGRGQWAEMTFGFVMNRL
jgi:hypothetical protein